MMFLVPLLALPLTFLAFWFLNFTADLSFRSSEQVRLDAFALSVCHSRKNFIVERIEGANQKIEFIQKKMDLLAEACQDGGELLPPFCGSVEAILQGLSAAGTAIEFLQNEQRVSFSIEFRALKAKLKSENELTSKQGILRYTSDSDFDFFNDGFQRETLSPKQSAWELAFMAKWPRRLVRTERFRSLHIFHYEFFPLKNLSGLQVEKMQVKETGFSRSRSSCEVLAPSSLQQYRVKRLRE